jgi:methionyl-tRNA formyltransferase
MRKYSGAVRVACFANNRVGWEVVRYLAGRGELVALVVHPESARRFGDEILAAAALPPHQVFAAPDLERPEARDRLFALDPELGVSAFYGYILRPAVFERFARGVVNIHPALLPWNRGTYPNVWSIVDATPAGATLHYIDAGVDTGDIVAQQRVEVRPDDTGQSLYARLERACIELFARAWPDLCADKLARVPQPAGGSHHYKRDTARIDEIDLDRQMRAGDLIDILRARTFPPYRGAYFVSEGKRIYLRLELEREPESE